MNAEVQILLLAHMPHGRTWTWHDPELLAVEALLDDAGRQQAIDEAFADLRARATVVGQHAAA